MRFSLDTNPASKRYAIIVEQGDASFGAYVPDLQGCVAVAETEKEVKRLVSETIKLHLEDLKNIQKK